MDAQSRRNIDCGQLRYPIELKQLRSAVLALSCGSFRRAADVLSVRHSALSRSVSQLEHVIGITLFERSTAGVRPTNEGERFLSRAKGALEQIDTLIWSAGAVSRCVSGQLSVGLCTSISNGNLREMLSDFSRRFPQIEMAAIERSPVGLNKCLRSKTVDVIIIPGRIRSSDFEFRSLWDERIFVSLPREHALAARQRICWSDLADQPILLSASEQGGDLQDMLKSRLLIWDNADNVQWHDASRPLINGLVKMGRGLSFVLESDIECVGSDVVYRELQDDAGHAEVAFHAHWLRENGNPALHGFVKLLSERYPSLSSGD
ncbi:LysR family transcriptional regulator [Bradyrhizobium sp. AUGA SZCCT0160]|uniref:LysR substrate-binding domain-containing protein n=1 Tax=Bradyrhizobium sp. AUGA SZCCT0160 TaxID=2807662 RepID=UPI001BA609BC|nr:LysR family transcriptional regulator [Bradyrhizobium sp. AUGA SZCCT0160]MBR1187357.1 LysR family transcriptional regulator [Bradyrhizobium sp. AUGA SZCCT0160]